MTTIRHHPPDSIPWPRLPLRLDLSATRAVALLEQCETALSVLDERAEPAHRSAILSVLATAQLLAAPHLVGPTLAEADALAADSAPALVYLLIARYASDLSPESLPARQRLVGQLMTLLASEACAEVSCPGPFGDASLA